MLGLSDERVWDATVFSKNRDRLLTGEVADGFFAAVLGQARGQGLLSDEHFTVDGTLIEAWVRHLVGWDRRFESPPLRQRVLIAEILGWNA